MPIGKNRKTNSPAKQSGTRNGIAKYKAIKIRNRKTEAVWLLIKSNLYRIKLTIYVFKLYGMLLKIVAGW